ncbi:MAG: cytochrome c3 family protein [Myxococcota bacterium]
MHPKTQRIIFCIVIATTVLTGAGVFWERGPDTVIYPKQIIPIYFPHNLHVREADEAKKIKGAGLDCDYCHEGIEKSERSSDRNIPGHVECEDCHSEWIGEWDEGKYAPARDCARCHTDIDPTATRTTTVAQKMTIPPPNLIFPHKNHIQAGVACTKCHANVPNKTVATRDDYPTMDRCLDCHGDLEVSVKCTTCHLSGATGRMVTRFAAGNLKPGRYHSFAIHDASFLRDHAVPAQKDRKYCENCHGEDDCLQCHDGIGRNAKYHPADWISTHFIRAKKDDFRCQTCHRLQTFCLNCHVRSGVATIVAVDNPANVLRRTIRVQGDPSTGTAVGPHPMAADGWLTPGSRNFHGFHAQRNIRSCAGCHQEQYCIQCHGSSFGGQEASGIGINPHGPNPQRLRGSTASKRNARVCLKCHNPNDPSWR